MNKFINNDRNKIMNTEFDTFFSTASLEEIKNLAKKAWERKQQTEITSIKKLELKGGDWGIGMTLVLPCYNVDEWRESGNARYTEEDAKIALKLKTERNRFHAFATEFMGEEYEFKYCKDNYYIYKTEDGIYHVSGNIYNKILGAIHMTKECAEYLCDKLNSGEIVL